MVNSHFNATLIEWRRLQWTPVGPQLLIQPSHYCVWTSHRRINCQCLSPTATADTRIHTLSIPFLWKLFLSLLGKTTPHCSLSSRAVAGAVAVAAVCCWGALCQGFHRSGALKTPMMPRLRTKLRTRTPTVPRKDGAAPWVSSHFLRVIMSAITPSIWKCVPTTALTWNSWWLWPVRGGWEQTCIKGWLVEVL